MTSISPEQLKQNNANPPQGPPAYTPYSTGSSASAYPGFAQGQTPGYTNGQPNTVYTTGCNYPTKPTTVVQTGHVRYGNQCPYCNTGYLRTEFTALGLLLALFCFPTGIICLMMMAERRCSSCNAKY